MMRVLLPRTDTAEKKLNGEEDPTESSAPRRSGQFSDERTHSTEDYDDESVEQCQGTFRWTRRNKVLLKTLRELLYKEVLVNLMIALDPDVISTILRYTFERTQPFVPHMRIDSRPSLTRSEDIMNLLMRDPDFEITPSTDYTIRKLVGRIFYGFEIHDSPYARVEDPNPCELMTNAGGVFLVPKTLCYWFLNQDQDETVPALCRFRHRIIDARVKFYVTGSYLQLSLVPISGVTDSLLLNPNLESPCLFEVSDEESDMSLNISDIDNTLISPYHRRSSNDSLAIEIANSWKDTRESVLVVVPKSPSIIMIPPNESEDESSVSDEPVQQLRVLDNSSLHLEISDSLENVPMASGRKKNVDDRKPRMDCLTVSDNPFERKNLTSTETTKTGSTLWYQDTPYTVTSPGSIARESGFPEELTLARNALILEDPGGGKEHTLCNNISTRPSLLSGENTQKIYVLELGAGFVQSQDLSLSFQHNKATPNPTDRDLSLDSSLELDIEEDSI